MTAPASRPTREVRPFHHGRNVYREQRDQRLRMMPTVHTPAVYSTRTWEVVIAAIVVLAVVIAMVSA